MRTETASATYQTSSLPTDWHILYVQVLGVHLTMDDRNVDANILSWNCKVLKVRPIMHDYFIYLTSRYMWDKISDHVDLMILRYRFDLTF